MAIILLADGSKTPLPHEKALAIWQILNDQYDGEPRPDQIQFCEKVKKVYLNRYRPDIPKLYLEQNAEFIGNK
ncbi:hypothetical protein KDA00_05585 [Candidatus Saccharibacteria bacterium]|nr:hypothetical protein [Candidatus Saccharibacteria bacterium]